MPFNLLRVYSELLELDHLSETARTKSLRGVFDRDFLNSSQLVLPAGPVFPAPTPGVPDKLDQLFWHLTTREVDKAAKSKSRDYEAERSRRLHWVRVHILQTIADPLTIFETEDGNNRRLYILNKAQRYLVVLEPLRKGGGYYLLSAHPLEPNGYRQIMQKYERAQRAQRRTQRL